ncbi:MAG: FUSC family protein, partial [Candidatus Methylumidiphilus sp.]
VTGTPTIPAMLYVFAVLYHPEQPDQNIYGALWLFPTLGLLAFGTSIAAQLILWPQDPEILLQQQLTERFDVIIRMLDRLAECDKVGESGFHLDTKEKPSPGSASRQFTLLAHAEIAHPALRVKHDERIDLIVEIDIWFNIASKLNRLIFDANPRLSLTEYDRAKLRAIATEGRDLRVEFLGHGLSVIESPQNLSDDRSLQSVPFNAVTLLLHRLEDAAMRVKKALASLHAPDALHETPEAEPEPRKDQSALPVWLPKHYWIDNMDALHYGMKFALGVMVCLFLVQALEWPGIDTAILTCVIVAQTSMGADYRKSVMRIMGASLGGLLAYVFIIVLEPALDTIAGFLLAIAPVLWLSAWVGSGSPRIAYIGTQIGYSFAHAVLPGYGPITHLESARDRVLGILIGITVVGVINYLLWPQRSERMSIKRLVSGLHTLSTFFCHGTDPPSSRQSSVTLMKTIDSDLQKALNFLENAQMEPGANQPGAEANQVALGLIIGNLHGIARVVQARHRYYLSEEFKSLPDAFHQRQDTFNRSISRSLLAVADSLAGKPAVATPSSRPALKDIEDSASQLSFDSTIDWPTAKAINACIDLDKILLDFMDELDSLVAGLTA